LPTRLLRSTPPRSAAIEDRSCPQYPRPRRRRPSPSAPQSTSIERRSSVDRASIELHPIRGVTATRATTLESPSTRRRPRSCDHGARHFATSARGAALGVIEDRSCPRPPRPPAGSPAHPCAAGSVHLEVDFLGGEHAVAAH